MSNLLSFTPRKHNPFGSVVSDDYLESKKNYQLNETAKINYLPSHSIP